MLMGVEGGGGGGGMVVHFWNNIFVRKKKSLYPGLLQLGDWGSVMVRRFERFS